MGAFPFLFASEPSSSFSVFSFAVETPTSSSSSSSSSFSSSSSDELCSESESLSMRTLGNEVLRVTGAIREVGNFAVTVNGSGKIERRTMKRH